MSTMKTAASEFTMRSKSFPERTTAPDPEMMTMTEATNLTRSMIWKPVRSMRVRPVSGLVMVSEMAPAIEPRCPGSSPAPGDRGTAMGAGGLTGGLSGALRLGSAADTRLCVSKNNATKLDALGGAAWCRSGRGGSRRYCGRRAHPHHIRAWQPRRRELLHLDGRDARRAARRHCRRRWLSGARVSAARAADGRIRARSSVRARAPIFRG
mmetsp:Transcript_41266/g.136744  ORF Transcript_41266/g.136744 Transcript_41266/m.136744 type:complete len:210 (-) Transcript_41266:859-1488(-)